MYHIYFILYINIICSQWLHPVLVAARSQVQFCDRSPAETVGVCCQCCVLSSRGLCDGPITHPEESYRLWCVVVCDLDT